MRIRFPPAAAERLGDLGGIRRDLLAHAGPQHVRDLLAHTRIVRLDLAPSGVELEALQPALERHVVVVGIGSGRRHADRRDRGGAAIGRHRHLLHVDQQRERPAHVAVLEDRQLVVEDHRRQRRVRVREGETLEPAVRQPRLLRQREHALGRGVVDDVELVVELGDHALIGRAGIDVGDVFRSRRAEMRDRGALPIVAQLPDEPAAVGIEAVERVGA